MIKVFDLHDITYTDHLTEQQRPSFVHKIQSVGKLTQDLRIKSPLL